MRKSRGASTGLPEMLVKCVPYAARWLSPRDFLRVFVDQGAPGHPLHTVPLSPFSLRRVARFCATPRVIVSNMCYQAFMTATTG